VKIVDANVLLYAVNADSGRHAEAHDWLDNALAGADAVGFTWLVMLAFLRISTHPSIFPRPLSVDTATDILQDWLTRPGAVVAEPSPRHAAILTGLLRETGSRGNLVNDTHLAAIASEYGADIASFDTDFDRFKGVRRYTPGS
jgi:toxin-antitoxin system PIN domain toxin